VTRQRLALLLAALVAATGVLPLLFPRFGPRLSAARRASSQEALQGHRGATARPDCHYIAQQREISCVGMAVGNQPDAPTPLVDVSLNAPSLGRSVLVSTETRGPPGAGTQGGPDHRALRGTEVASDTYIAELSPAMDVCFLRKARQRLLPTLESPSRMQRQVQRIRVGERGTARVRSHWKAARRGGPDRLRAAVLSGETVAESRGCSASAAELPRRPACGTARAGHVPRRLGILARLGWTIAVEQPADEALRARGQRSGCSHSAPR